MLLRNGVHDQHFLITFRKILLFLVAAIAVLLVLAFAGLWYISNYPSIPDYKPIEEVVYLNEKKGACRDFEVDDVIRSTMPDGAFDKTTRDPNSSYQGWCEPYRQVYYRLPQGTTFFGLRYDWVANLERPVGHEPLMSREYMESIGYIYDGAKLPNDNNPADLPIGLTWHYDEKSGHKILDVTCAACHSSQLTYQGKALQIDGGSGSHALTSSSPSASAWNRNCCAKGVACTVPPKKIAGVEAKDNHASKALLGGAFVKERLALLPAVRLPVPIKVTGPLMDFQNIH